MKLIEPPEHLNKLVLTRIEKLEHGRALRVRVTYGVLSVLSLLSAVFATNYIAGDVAQSGFLSYSSLLFSDGGYIISYWREFLFVLAESMPFVGIIMLLTSVLVLMVTIREIIKNYGTQKIFTISYI